MKRSHTSKETTSYGRLQNLIDPDKLLNMTTEDKTSKLDLPANLSGYEEFDEFVVQQWTQGGRVHYSMVVSVQQCTLLFPIPDPAKPFDDNRQVKENRATAFANYVMNFPGWHAGALTIRSTSGLTTFDVKTEYHRVRLGVLRVPKGRSKEFFIVDGQHRILGLLLLLQMLSTDRSEWLTKKQSAQRASDNVLLREADKQLARIEAIHDRIRNESVLVNLIVEDDQVKARQLFVDVAENALGVPKAVKTRFDQNKVVNRALVEVLAKPPVLIHHRVDDQSDRVQGSNPNLIGAGNVAEIIRTLELGIAGRVSNRQEKELSEVRLAKSATAFFDALVEAFPALKAVADEAMTPADLRKTSLLGSSTMLRILAGVYHEVSKSHGEPTAKALLKKLAPHMAAPIDPATSSGRMWIACGETEAFVAGSTAPGARSQEVKDVVATVSGWADNPPAELT